MVNRPFRVAFWALAVNLGLSLCLLMSDPVVVRLALAPSPELESRDAAPPLLAGSKGRTDATTQADGESSPAATPGTSSPSPSDVETHPQDHNNVIVDSGTAHISSGPVGYETPPLPIREVSANSEAGYPWLLHDASRSTFGTGTFEELPPPPEFAADGEPANSSASAPPYDEQTATQLAGLGERLENLHGELTELRATQVAVERTVTALATLTETAAAASRRMESPLEVRAVVMQASLTGELRDGALPALRRSGIAGDMAIEEGPWPDVSWAVCHCPADVVTAWLQRASSADRIAQKTMLLSADSHAELDAMRLLPPRMVQVRGSSVFEWAPRPAWGGRLDLRRAGGGSPVPELEFRSAATSDGMRAASSDWRRASIPEGGTLIVTGRDRAHLAGAAGDEAPRHEQAVGRGEIIVVLTPRLIVPNDNGAPEPARPEPVIEAPELPAHRE